MKTETTKLAINIQKVENKIAVIRNLEVIADADVAALYGVETKRVNEAVKNNPEKFPARYMFELTNSELQDLRSKISTTTDARVREELSLLKLFRARKRKSLLKCVSDEPQSHKSVHRSRSVYVGYYFEGR